MLITMHVLILSFVFTFNLPMNTPIAITAIIAIWPASIPVDGTKLVVAIVIK